MSWSFTGDKPIYSQLIEQLQLRIVTGFYPPGGKLDTVRDLAQEASVNPNTMQRALAELERQGLVYSQRTSGRFVTENAEDITRLRENLAREKVDRFLSEMEKLGFTRQDVCALLKEDRK